MSITHLPAAARTPTKWRNGGGLTREIAAYPPGATMENFAWRVSMAEIQAPGPFSIFPQTDRILTIISGTLALTIGAAPPITLSHASPPHPFPADIPTHGTPLAGPVTDLNLMFRRGAYTASVTPLHTPTLTIPTPTCLLFALTEAHASHPLAQHDALLLEQEQTLTLPLQGDFLLIALTADNKN